MAMDERTASDRLAEVMLAIHDLASKYRNRNLKLLVNSNEVAWALDDICALPLQREDPVYVSEAVGSIAYLPEGLRYGWGAEDGED